ncbi:hypothetical protein OAP07_01275 [Bacteroidia bacterium]|nr:hypothetical protein [Bacteroidia bacterium]
MRFLILLVIYSTFHNRVSGQINYSLFGGSTIHQAGFQQTFGLNMSLKQSNHQIFYGFDKALSADNSINSILGYKYILLTTSKITFEGVVNIRLGNLITSGSVQPGYIHYCRGPFVLEESIGVGYMLTHKKHPMFSLNPFINFGVIHGFRSTENIGNIDIIKCEHPSIYVAPQAGVRYLFKIK